MKEMLTFLHQERVWIGSDLELDDKDVKIVLQTLKDRNLIYKVNSGVYRWKKLIHVVALDAERDSWQEDDEGGLTLYACDDVDCLPLEAYLLNEYNEVFVSDEGFLDLPSSQGLYKIELSDGATLDLREEYDPYNGFAFYKEGSKRYNMLRDPERRTL